MTNTIESTHLTDHLQHSIAKSIGLHLLPGLLILIFFVIVAPTLEGLGYPVFLALLLAIAFVLIPFELGYLFYRGKKRNSTYSLNGFVLYREPLLFWQYAALATPLFLWVGLIMMLVSPTADTYLIENVFSWLPGWFFISTFEGNWKTTQNLCWC